MSGGSGGASARRVLVVGAGAIGGTVSACLAAVGADVTAVTTNEEIHRAVSERGFRTAGEGTRRAVRGRIELGVPAGEKFDIVLLATQPPQVEDAARAALGALADGGIVVCFQNGLCESRIARIAGGERTVGAIVAWGASMPEPGLYDRTSAGGFTLGRLNGEPDDRVRELGALLEAVGPVELTSNLLGARWSKLALNCAVSSLGTIGGERLGPLVRVRRYRRVALEIFTEVVEVARAEGVALEKVAGTLDLDWIALSAADRAAGASAALTAKHALLLAVGLRYRRLRSSMLSAIERGRVPAIDFLNGEIVTHGARHGLTVPVNAAVVETVRALARGDERPSRALLDRLYESTRPQRADASRG
ncbi:MAG TPA: 2-dehydropantoate 2-reductase [Kofleriaceae bacterium]|nr:2-dehydropantoate 2-reductase [Kofleriaceae bacterium]